MFFSNISHFKLNVKVIDVASHLWKKEKKINIMGLIRLDEGCNKKRKKKNSYTFKYINW